jgi:hypothetical protein
MKSKALKQKAGRVVSKPENEEAGKEEKTGGTVQKKAGQVEKVLEK